MNHYIYKIDTCLIFTKTIYCIKNTTPICKQTYTPMLTHNRPFFIYNLSMCTTTGSIPSHTVIGNQSSDRPHLYGNESRRTRKPNRIVKSSIQPGNRRDDHTIVTPTIQS